MTIPGRAILAKAANPVPGDGKGLDLLPVASVGPAAVAIATTSLPDATEDSAYSQALDGSGFGSLAWELASGALPTGLSLSAGGTISGTPTTSETANFTVRLTDTMGRSTTKALSIVVAAGDDVTNMTLQYSAADAANFSLTGAAVNTMLDTEGDSDLDMAFVAGTKANRDTTHPVNTSDPTVDTNNAFCEYRSPAGGTIADVFPAGTGTYFLIAYFDSHPDSFNAPDWIFGSERAGNMGTDVGVCIVDGPKFQVRTNSGGQINEQSITLDAWHLITVRIGNGAGQLKVQLDDDTEVAVAGVTIGNLTGRLKKWADSGGAGRADMAEARERFYSDVLTDERVAVVKAALRALVADV